MANAMANAKKIIRPRSSGDVHKARKEQEKHGSGMMAELRNLKKDMGFVTSNPMLDGFTYDSDDVEGRRSFASQTEARDTVASAEYQEHPFPCGFPGCHTWHGDITSGVCPAHRAPSRSGRGRGLCQMCTLSAPAAARMRKRVNLAKVLFMTIGMGVIESNDKVVLAVTCGAVAQIVACNAYIFLLAASASVIAANAGVAGVLLGTAGFFYLLFSLTRQIEGMEVTAKR